MLKNLCDVALISPLTVTESKTVVSCKTVLVADPVAVPEAVKLYALTSAVALVVE